MSKSEYCAYIQFVDIEYVQRLYKQLTIQNIAVEEKLDGADFEISFLTSLFLILRQKPSNRN